MIVWFPLLSLTIFASMTAAKILSARKPKFVYNVNRNGLLLLLNALPKRMQLWVIHRVLK